LALTPHPACARVRALPPLLRSWHMSFCSFIAFVTVRVLKVVKGVNMPQRDYLRRVMPIGALYAASLWLSNSAYLHLSVSFIQMTKALMPGLVYATVRARQRLRPARARARACFSPQAPR
jgi:predicted neutral ceramidase superfamily lipid hydrolase